MTHRGLTSADIDDLHVQAVHEQAQKQSNRMVVIKFTNHTVDFKIKIAVLPNEYINVYELRLALLAVPVSSNNNYMDMATDLYAIVINKYPNRRVVVDILQNDEFGCCVEYANTLVFNSHT